MSVIISGDKLIVHSYMVPVVFDSIQEPGVRYLIADGKWTPIPNHLGYKHITHFQKEYKGAKNEAFKNTFEQEVDGSKLHLDSVVIVDVNTLNKLKTKTDGIKR